MKILPLAAAFAACLSAPALAQDDAATSTSSTSTGRLEPYVAVMGGLHQFNRGPYRDAPPSNYHGWLVEGVAGLNYDLGPVVIGAEGSVAKGIDKDINWEYGAAGRVGLKAGKDSMFFAKVGYQWTQFDDSARPPVSTDAKFDGMTYGAGFELSLADMGSTAERSNLRLRAQVDTRGNFHSFRPMAGLAFKF